MKLYKIDYSDKIGNYVVTVPTDSQFLVGIGNGSADADVELFDGATQLTPETEKIGTYTIYSFETDGNPYRKVLKGTINGNAIDVMVICAAMSVAYRDIDTGVVAEEVVELVEESGAFQTTLKPLTLETPSDDIEINIDDTNFMDVERTIYEIGTTDALVASKTITANIDLADFPVETGSTQMFKLNLKINCLGDAVTIPDGLIAINITGGELSTSDFYASYISGPTALSTVIGDSNGTSLLVELVFDANGGYAFIKGASYIE